jgi:hypothetical protein
LKEEEERLREQHKFANILLLQSRSPDRGLPFSSSLKSFSRSKFEKTFEAIRKNEWDCKETLKRYNFKKPRR